MGGHFSFRSALSLAALTAAVTAAAWAPLAAITASFSTSDQAAGGQTGGGQTGGAQTGGGQTGGAQTGGGQTGGGQTGGGQTGGGQTGGGQTGGAQTGGGQTGGGQTGGAQTGGAQTGGGQGGGEQMGSGEPAAPAPTTGAVAAQQAGQNLFGYDYFATQRKAIDAYRKAIAEVKPVVDSGQEAAQPKSFIPQAALNVPDTYVLSSGDKLRVTVSSAVRAPEDFDVAVDELGRIKVPVSGRTLVARGLTLKSVESLLATEVARVVRNPRVVVTMGELRNVSVSVTGRSYAPDLYQVPSTTTVYNVVYATGGPTFDGSLRRIQLRRANGETRTIDFYAFLLGARAMDDVAVQSGDVIFIPPAQTRVEVKGEVRLPAVYELIDGETAADALRYAGGVKPTGVAQSVLINSVRPGIDRRLIEVDALNTGASQTKIYDGDVIEVRSVRQPLSNAVILEGPVDQPGQYPVLPGLKVSDLIAQARGLLPDASERADILRLNADGVTRALIPVNLRAALAGDPVQNAVLAPNDILRVYPVSVFTWLRDREIKISGAVPKPGSYQRADGQRVSDLIIQAGGLNADAYADQALLKRFNPDGTPGPIVRVRLRAALQNGSADDLLLQDRDELQVLTVREAIFQAEQRVEIVGAVQRPATVIRFEGMRVSDLLFQAGGPVEAAFVDYAFLQRENPDGTPGELVKLDLRRVLAGDDSANLLLQNRDRLQIFSQAEATIRIDGRVEIAGAVQRPASYRLGENMRIRDLIEQAGGLLLNAAQDRAFLQRAMPDGLVGPLVIIDLQAALQGDEEANVLLQDKDVLSVYSRSQAERLPDRQVTISGAVQRPGPYAASPNLTLADLIALAGGLLPNFSGNVEIAMPNVQVDTPVERVKIEGSFGAWRVPDVQIPPGAMVSLTTRADILERPLMITIQGAVNEPGTFLVNSRAIPVSEILKRAGGPTEEAFLFGSQFLRRADSLVQPNQKAISPALIDLLTKLNETEYRRAEALLELDKLRLSVASGTSGISIPGMTAPAPPAAAGDLSEAAVKAVENVAQAGVQRARAFIPGELLPVNGNLNVRLDRAWDRPGGREDIALQDGDVIYIPMKPVNVVIAGAVFAPQALVFQPGLSVEEYVDRCGGLTPDSDKDAVMIVRANGQVDRFRRGLRVELGDYIFVPTKVQSIRFKEAGGDLQQVVGSLTSAGITIGILNSLFK